MTQFLNTDILSRWRNSSCVGRGRSHSRDNNKYSGLQSSESVGLNSALFDGLSMGVLTVPVTLIILNVFHDSHALKIQRLFFTSFYMHLAYAVG